MGTGTAMRGVVAAALTVLAVNQAACGATARIYHIGNSLTDQVSYSNFQALAQSRGHTHIWARQMIPGSPLGNLWNNRNSGFSEQPYGYPENAFANYTWDALVMQPFDWSVDVESQAANDYWNLALNHSPDCKAYIHMAWPRMDAQYGDFASQWDDTTHGWTWTRRYFEQIVDRVTTAHASKAPVVAVPMGEVMYELDKKIRLGQVPGMNSIWDLYNDGVHLNSVGSYLTALTHYAVIYKDDPVGLPTTGFSVPANQVLIIQQTVRDVVLAYARCRVSSFGPYPVTGVTVMPDALELNTSRTATLAFALAPGNATNRAGSWSSLNTGVATVGSDGTVSAVAAGTARIVVTTTDGGFKDTCNLTVVATGTAVTGVSIAPDSASVLRTATTTLSATVSPAGATNTAVIWRSLDPTLATVNSSGVVTGVAKGLTYVVATTVNGAKSDTVPVKVTIPNNPPVPVMDVNPLVGYAPMRVQFDGHRSYDPDSTASGDFVLGYDWDFGDGSTWAFTVSPSHTYGAPGTYTARLRVLDDNETRSGWVSTVVEVRERDATVICYEPFEYTAGALTGRNGGQGWGAGWDVQNGDNSVPGYNVAGTAALTFSDLRTTGLYGVGGDQYQGCGRAFDVRDTGAFKDCLTFAKVGLPGTTLWTSVLLSKLTGDGAWVAMALQAAGINWILNDTRIAFGYFGAPSDNGGTKYWGMQFDGTTYRSAKAVTTNQAALLVAKLEFGVSSTTVSLWVNPSQIGGAAPSSADVVQTYPTAFTFAGMNFMAGSGWNESAIDEIRFGYTYAAVTPSTSVSSAPAARASSQATVPARARITNGRLYLSGAVSRVEVYTTGGRLRYAGEAAEGMWLAPGAALVRVLEHGVWRTIPLVSAR